MVPFIYSSFTLISTLIFHFHHLHFKNKILSRIANIYDDYWHKLTKKFKKVIDIVGNISLFSLVAWQNLSLLNFQKIQNFICIQACDRPNFKKPERKRTFMSTQKVVRSGVLKICHAFADSIILNNRSIVHFGGWWKWEGHLLVINGWPQRQ